MNISMILFQSFILSWVRRYLEPFLENKPGSILIRQIVKTEWCLVIGGFAVGQAMQVRMSVLEEVFRHQIRTKSVLPTITSLKPLSPIRITSILGLIAFRGISTGFLTSLAIFVVVFQRLNCIFISISQCIQSYTSNSEEFSHLNSIYVVSDKQLTKVVEASFQHLRYDSKFHNVDLRYDSILSPLHNKNNRVIKKGKTNPLGRSSGAGKSSTLDLLAGIYVPTEGQILFNGCDFYSFHLESWQKRSDVVSQDTSLYNLLLADIISFGTPGVTSFQIQDSAIKAQASAFISQLPDGYGTMIGERGYSLSVAQRHRIFARKILRSPEFLFHDQATIALDTHNEPLVQEAIESFEKEATVLVIAQRLSTIANPDQIYLLQSGRIVQHGNHDYLFAQKTPYSNLLKLQSADVFTENLNKTDSSSGANYLPYSSITTSSI